VTTEASYDVAMSIGAVEHLSIDADLDTRACYALSVNRRPPVRSVTVRNLDGVFSGTLTISVTSEWTAAGRPPIREVTQAIDCPSVGNAIEVDFSTSRLDDIALAYLDDKTSADVIVTLRDADGHEQSRRFEILVLARNQWIMALQDVTAAFIQADHPATAEIRAAAAQLLAERTGSNALQGYQKGPERAVQIAEALYDALGQRVTTYLDVPPSEFESDTEGQRVRPLDQLLETGEGNCIELACAFAACAYSAGLQPVVFIVHGHSFGGIYLDDRREGANFNRALTTEFAAIMNVMEQGAVLPIETTAIASDLPFSGALERVRHHFAERDGQCGTCARMVGLGMAPDDHPHLMSVLDVARARADGVLFLPVRTIQDGQEVLIIDQGGGQAPLVERRDPVTRRLLPTSVPVRVQKWKTALLDLSQRNQLISFKPMDQGLQLLGVTDQIGAVEDFLVDGGTVRIFGDADINGVLQAAGVTSWVKANEDQLRPIWEANRAIAAAVRKLKRTKVETVDADGKVVQRRELEEIEYSVPERARDLLRRAKVAEADTGVNNLHLALGMVSWPFDGVDGTKGPVTSPLFLVPIRMQVPRGDRPASIQLAEDSMTSPNYSLIESLRKKFGLRLSWFDEDMSDDSGLDIERGLDEVRREFMAAGLADRGLRVEATAAIGMFPFQKVRLWKDLTDHWEEFLANPVVKHLVEVGTGAFEDPADPDGLGAPDYTDSTLLNPQPADGAQTRAIVRALAGQSFVLEGPPGTGKSQTITNLLANALSRGMKVLFVAEKPDARAVVRERLQEVGLDPFCLDLHDQGSGPQAIKDQLRDALDFRPKDVEAKWETLAERYESVTGILAGYRDRVHGPTSAGRSYFDSFETLLEMGTEPAAPIGRGLVDVDSEQVAALRRTLLELPSYAEAAQVQPGHPWSFVGDTDIDALDRQQLADTISDIARALPAVTSAPATWSTAFAACRSITDLQAIVACARVIDQGALPTGSQWRAISRADWQDSTSTALDSLRSALATAEGLGVDPAVLTRDLSAQAASVTAAASSFVMGRKGRIAAAVGDLASAPALVNLSPADLSAAFATLASAAQTYRSAIDRLRSSEGMGLRILHDTIDTAALATLDQRASDLRAVATTIDAGGELGTVLQACVDADTALPRLADVEGLVAGLQALLALTAASEATTDLWLADRTVAEAVNASMGMWQAGVDGLAFMALRRWLDLRTHVRDLDTDLFADFHRALLTGRIEADIAVDAFDRALLNAVLTVVGEQNTFDVFDQNKQDRAVRRFTELTAERQEILRDLIPARLHARRRFDSAAGAGTVANLRTELASNRRGARSVRHLISKYPEIISELTPCFLMGPDSVAKFLPPGAITFDLIVFDEASQIRVEEAIGAMGRAQGVVIVGDSRQMPPSSAFVSRAGDGEDDEYSLDDLDSPVEDAESILEEAVEAGLPREMLAWHYRSRDEVLITFSNRNYYENRLGTFPSPYQVRPGVGITYHRVNGQFLHSGKDVSGNTDAEVERKHGGPIQTNPIEADAIVAEIRRHVHDPDLSQYSLGVVTLNKKQAELIEKKIRDSNDTALIDLLDHEDPTRALLVLNLESVQGRERDIIILGTSFSNRAGTTTMPLQFGPLTARGGERRLNVAITRARRQVIVYSSFDPEQLASAKSLGLQHLCEYLQLAQKASHDRDGLDHAQPATPDRYIAEVAAALQAAGLRVRVGYGLSSFKVDIAVGRPDISDRWLVGVLLDGREWAGRSLVLDRDGLPLTVLSRMMDWPAVARIWLPAWRRDRQEVIDGIRTLVDQVAEGQPLIVEPVGTDEDLPHEMSLPPAPVPPAPVPPAPPEPALTPDDPAPVGLTPPIPEPAIAPEPPREMRPTSPGAGGAVRTYRPLVVEGTAGTPDDIEHSGPIITALLTSLADTDGPIELVTALKAIARVFGLDRVRQARLDVMARFVPKSRLVRTPFGDFLFPEELLLPDGSVSSEFTWYRDSTFAERKIDQIAPQEFANAAVKITRDSFSIQVDELAVALLDAFGYGRKTADSLAAATQRIQWAVAQGYLVQREGGISTS
jgi:AAA domain/Protein of unknown function (DUF4011)/REase_MTES_1575